VALLFLLLAGPVVAKPTDEQVDKAIQKGVDYLWTQQQPDGSFLADKTTGWETQAGGCEALGMMALAVVGVPMTDARMKKGIDHLVTLPLVATYTRSCRIIALSRVLNHQGREPNPRIKEILAQDVKWLMSVQIDEKTNDKVAGMWHYGPPSQPDFSNTQFALLALQEFEMAGGELPNTPFERSLRIYLERQKPDGGWNYGWLDGKYQDGRPAHFDTEAYGSMTAAGTASMFIIRDKLFGGLGCPCRNGKSGRSPDKVDLSIDRALEWLGKNYQANRNPRWTARVAYWNYSCERAALASGLKYFGEHDWYAEGADYILKTCKPSGSWDDKDIPEETCYNLMFLAKGRAPVLLNKLQFAGAWGLHPRDAANLARYVGRAKEQPIAWQVITLDAPVADWHDAPILYISTEAPIKLTDEHKKKLREYTDTGGTILFEASCGNTAVASWWRRTSAEIWPEWELKALDKDHPLWTADLKLSGKLPSLFGASDGLRTFLIFTQQGLSCPWHTMGVTKDRTVFDLGCNLYAYTSDRGKLRSRLAANRLEDRQEFQEATLAAGSHNILRLRLLKHGGDWYITRHYKPLEALAGYLEQKAKVTLQVGEPITATEAALKQTDVLWLTGRKGLVLSADETAALKAWLAGGGYLVAEACLGDEAFDGAFTEAAKSLGLEVRPLGKEDPLVTGGMAGCTGFKLAPVDFTSSLRTDRVGKFHADFCGLYLNAKLVGVYSRFDVSLAVSGIKAFGNRGYATMDGRAVAANMLLPATTMGANPAAEQARPGEKKGEETKAADGKSETAKPAVTLPEEYQVKPN
jgi:hypothetical protein